VPTNQVAYPDNIADAIANAILHGNLQRKYSLCCAFVRILAARMEFFSGQLHNGDKS
jgi:hypothetical protein